MAECLANDDTYSRHVTCRASMWAMMGEDELEVAAERIYAFSLPVMVGSDLCHE